MDTYGCTSPNGYNQNHICKDSFSGNLSLYKFREISQLQKDFELDECPYPCHFLKIKHSRQYELKNHSFTQSMISFTFQKFVKVSRSKYSYQGLEFLAEFGGYVGLFLGISVFQISKMFENALLFVVKNID